MEELEYQETPLTKFGRTFLPVSEICGVQEHYEATIGEKNGIQQPLEGGHTGKNYRCGVGGHCVATPG